MKDVSYETVELLVAFAYGQEFCITKKNAQEIIQAADCYQFDILKNHCEQWVVKTSILGTYKKRFVLSNQFF